MGVLKKIIAYGERLILTIGVLSLSTIIIIITLGIISRYVFGSPFAWTEELASFLFIVLCFSGASVAAYRKKHVVADYIINRVNPKIRHVIQIILHLLIIAFLAVVFYASISLQPNLQIHRSINLGIPRNYYYLPLLIASFYMLLVYLIEFYEIVRGLTLGYIVNDESDDDEVASID
jgi:TRAP-type transport system small permease protein